MFWHQLEIAEPPAGFPRSPVVLTSIRPDKEGTGEVLAVVGGRAEEKTSQSAKDIDELCFGGGEAPVDVWTRHSSGVGGSSGSSSCASARPFERTVIAFPPKARSGFSLTHLDKLGHRSVLIGGHSGQPGRYGQCLGDIHVLEYRCPADTAATVHVAAAEVDATSPASDSSGSDGEDIFFAEDFEAEVAATPPGQSCGMRAMPPCLWSSHRSQGRLCESSDEEEKEDNDEEIQAPMSRPGTSCGAAIPRTLQDVMSSVGSSKQVRLSCQTDSRSAPVPKMRPPRPESRSTTSEHASGKFNWRAPLVQGAAIFQPRAAHTAVFQPPLNDNGEPSVLVYGGLDDSGLPLGDVFELRVVETHDVLGDVFESVWTCVDDGGTRGCEAAPWEQQKRPRPRACHSAVFWQDTAQPCMVIFGGLALGPQAEPLAQGDTWILETAGTTGPMWRRPMMKGGAPARRWGHGACIVGSGRTGASARMLLCGGIDSSGRALSDCWVLNLEESYWEAVESLGANFAPIVSGLSSRNGASLMAPPELGRCTATWSVVEDAVIVWGGQGFWAWQEPESSCRRRCPEPKLLCSGEAAPAQQQRLLTKEPSTPSLAQYLTKSKSHRRQGSRSTARDPKAHPDIPRLPKGVSKLPEVQPPPRRRSNHLGPDLGGGGSWAQLGCAADVAAFATPKATPFGTAELLSRAPSPWASSRRVARSGSPAHLRRAPEHPAACLDLGNAALTPRDESPSPAPSQTLPCLRQRSVVTSLP